ncbi:MAG: EndoU domain-containing protein [Fibrobacteraceae bacterium]|nr:EndoU domain-containing protein [Fibrobacteraceae bacterium]
MGTGRTGRFYSKAGSARVASEYSVVHSSEGTFKKTRLKEKDSSGKPKIEINLKSGGHGEHNLKLLEKYGIKYNIVKTYPNGVRVGNVPKHDKKTKQNGTGQSWFPKNWSKKDIKKAGEQIARQKSNRNKKDGQVMFGNYKGVRVGVIKTNGKIGTIFPDVYQPSKLWRKK